MSQSNKKKSQVQFFRFNTWILKMCLLWPGSVDYDYNNERLMKDSVMILSLMPCAIPILADFILQLNSGNLLIITAVVEDLIALICIIGMIYLVICFINNRRTITRLMIDIKCFSKYGNSARTKEVDDKANFISKLFMFYGILGNFMYMLMPQLSVHKCHENRNARMVNDGAPCGLVVRSIFPFKFDYTPMFEIVFVHQIYTCTMVSLVVLVLTNLFCGFLMHIVNQLENLRVFIKELHENEKFNLEKFYFIIRYHIHVTNYSQETAKAFSTMLLFYITLISVILSVLCFEVIMVDAFEDSVRFTLHLFGWLVILFSVSYSGQLLINESTAVADDIYSLDWFDFPVDIQKKIQTIIRRAQKPLVMDAAGMGIVSLHSFLSVLSSAYSFFTLLLKLKE